jgi:peroxiredoxin
MSIQVGDKIPEATLFHMVDGNIQKTSTDELFSAKHVVLFALPGAFTPTCSALHLPGFLARSAAFHSRGIDDVICLSVNDPYVMALWEDQQNVAGRVSMIADGNAEFTQAVGLEIDRSESGMGLRSQRYAMIVEDGIVKVLRVEEPGKFEVSDADSMLTFLNT